MQKKVYDLKMENADLHEIQMSAYRSDKEELAVENAKLRKENEQLQKEVGYWKQIAESFLQLRDKITDKLDKLVQLTKLRHSQKAETAAAEIRQDLQSVKFADPHEDNEQEINPNPTPTPTKPKPKKKSRGRRV